MDFRNLIAYAGMLVVLLGCGHKELPDRFTEPLPTMVLYTFDAKRGRVHRTIGPNDKEYKSISKFLLENKEDWEYDIRDYVQTMYLKGPDFSINCMSDGVVLNYKNIAGIQVQISKSSKIAFCGLKD